MRFPHGFPVGAPELQRARQPRELREEVDGAGVDAADELDRDGEQGVELGRQFEEALTQHDLVHDRVRVTEVVLVPEGGLQQVGGQQLRALELLPLAVRLQRRTVQVMYGASTLGPLRGLAQYGAFVAADEPASDGEEGPFARDGAALGDDFGDNPVAVGEDPRLRA